MSKDFDVEHDAHGNVVLVKIVTREPGKRTQTTKLTAEDLDYLLQNLLPSLVLALRSRS